MIYLLHILSLPHHMDGYLLNSILDSLRKTESHLYSNKCSSLRNNFDCILTRGFGGDYMNQEIYLLLSLRTVILLISIELYIQVESSRWIHQQIFSTKCFTIWAIRIADPTSTSSNSNDSGPQKHHQKPASEC